MGGFGLRWNGKRKLFAFRGGIGGSDRTKVSVPLLLVYVAICGMLGGGGIAIDALAEDKDGRSKDDVSAPNAYPPGKLGEVVRLGEQVVMRTAEHPLSKEFVGNQLNCTSCHLNGGRDRHAATFVGVASAYPAWAPREQKVITLEDRILNCFIRSQNGTRPPNGGELSVALTAYISWLSEGYKIKLNAEKSLGPNRLQMLDLGDNSANADKGLSIQRGKRLYESRCADCHLEDGSGGEGPPVWGPQSFNSGAGMAKVDKLASWLKVAMPPGETDLKDGEAVDIAAYVNSQPRPTFKSQVGSQ